VKRFIAAAALLLMAPAMAPAQNANPPYRGQSYLFFGLGPGTGSYWSANTLIKQVGFGGEGFLYKGLGAGAEAAYASW